MSADVRPSPLAGRWYPQEPNTLRQMLEASLSTVEQPQGNLIGLMAPHAGLRFSGHVAGAAFAHSRGLEFDFVVVIGPSHHSYPYPLLTSGHSHFETPLGEVRVAPQKLAALQDHIAIQPVKNDPEHSIEMELIFLQHVLGNDFELLPVMMLDQSWEACERLASALRQVFDKSERVLWVASSDLSHFYEQGTANQLDKHIIDAIQQNAPAQIIELDESGEGFACGRGAIATVLLASRPKHISIGAYATSGDINGDYSRVVGYTSASLRR